MDTEIKKHWVNKRALMPFMSNAGWMQLARARTKNYDNLDTIDLTGFGLTGVQEAKSFASNINDLLLPRLLNEQPEFTGLRQQRCEARR